MFEWGRKQALDHWEGQKRVESLSTGQGCVWGAGSTPGGKGGAQPHLGQPCSTSALPWALSHRAAQQLTAILHRARRMFNVLPKTAVPEVEWLQRAVNESQGEARNQPSEHTVLCAELNRAQHLLSTAEKPGNQRGTSLWCWTPGSAPAEMMVRFFLSSTDVKSAQFLSFLTDTLYLVPGWLKDSLIIICTYVKDSCTKKERIVSAGERSGLGKRRKGWVLGNASWQ